MRIGKTELSGRVANLSPKSDTSRAHCATSAIDISAIQPNRRRRTELALG
jgi:hypothetical protein